MTKQFTFKDMTHSKSMEDIANNQLAKVEKFLSHEADPVFIELVFQPSKVHEHHKVEMIVKTPNYDEFVSYEKEGMPFYETLAHVIDVMYHNLLKAKERRIEQRKEVGRHNEFKKQR
jgi:ribosomal subunit interface protein